MSQSIDSLAERLARIFNKYAENQKRPREYGLDEPLYPSEIHTLMLIGNKPGSGVTDLAKRAGITKGAVSQMIKRLENKELITRSPNPDNKRKVILNLTNKGKVAYYSHEKYHEESDRELLAFLRGLSRSRLRLLEEFLVLIEKGVDKRFET